jgi:hypothetical protein
MAKIVLAWELGGGLGHVARLRPIVSALTKRDHEVWIIAKDLLLVESTMGGSAIRKLQAPVRGQLKDRIESVSTFAHVLHNTSFADVLDLRARANSWRDAFRVIRPQVVLCEHSPTALLAARGLPVGRAVIGTGFSCPALGNPMPTFCEERALTREEMIRQEQSIVEHANTVLNEWSVNSISAPADLYRDVDAQFLGTFPEVDHYPDREGGEYFGYWSETDGDSPAWPPGDGPKVFGYLKPVDGLSALLAVLDSRKLRSLIVVPGLNPEAVGKLQSPFVRIVTRPVNMEQACQQCDLSILHATHGSVAAALLAGKPMLLLPLFLEQGITARRVVALGAGVSARIDRPKQIESALRALVDLSKYAEAAHRFSIRYAEFNQQAQIGKIVSRIESVASSQT